MEAANTVPSVNSKAIKILNWLNKGRWENYKIKNLAAANATPYYFLYYKDQEVGYYAFDPLQENNIWAMDAVDGVALEIDENLYGSGLALLFVLIVAKDLEESYGRRLKASIHSYDRAKDLVLRGRELNMLDDQLAVQPWLLEQPAIKILYLKFIAK
jgi:hypothetical protein